MSEEMGGGMGAQVGKKAFNAGKSQATAALGKGIKSLFMNSMFWFCLLSFVIAYCLGFTAKLCEKDIPLYYLATQCVFFVFGILHVVLMYALCKWAGKYNFSSEILFSLLIMVLVAAGYTLSFYFRNKNLAFLFSTAVIPFILPVIIHWTFNFSFFIPPKEYKKWFFPDKPIVTDMENMDLSNFAVITFIFSKKFGDTALSNFQSKAPYSIRLGDLFYFFVQEWNYKNPGNTIEYLAAENQPFGWHFCVKKSWWQPKKYLDADLTVKENKIAVNAVITTERVALQNPA